MKVGIAADHGGYELKQKTYILLGARRHQIVDFGDLQFNRDDDYSDFAIPLARAVADGVPTWTECGSEKERFSGILAYSHLPLAQCISPPMIGSC